MQKWIDERITSKDKSFCWRRNYCPKDDEKLLIAMINTLIKILFNVIKKKRLKVKDLRAKVSCVILYTFFKFKFFTVFEGGEGFKQMLVSIIIINNII